MTKLTLKQRAFVEHYIITNNATEAAKRAGYSVRTAKSMGSENLSKPAIQAALSSRLEEAHAKNVATADEVLQTLTKIMRGETTSATLRGVGQGAETIDTSMPPTTSERQRAAEMLGKRYGIFEDRLRVDSNAAVTIVDDIE